MRSIPGMVVICPADDIEAKQAVKAAYKYEGPVYLRFGRLAVPVFHDDSYKFEIGKEYFTRSICDSECIFSIKGIEVRQMVNRLRRKGVPIASSGSGYFYAATEQEVRATIAHLTRRISGIAAAISGLNRSLEQFDTAQTRLPLEGGDAVE